MQPTGIRQGSIGMPESMKKALEEKALNRKPPATEPVKQPAEIAGLDTVEAAPSMAVEEKPEAEIRAEQLAKLKAELENSLDTKITEEDIQNYIFKGKLIKTVSIIPGKFKGTFQTHTPKELAEIDVHMAAFRDESKQTPKGIANEESIVTLAYFWTHFAGKPLGNTPEVRMKQIRQMGGHVVSLAAKAWDDLNALLQVTLNEEQFVKKS